MAADASSGPDSSLFVDDESQISDEKFAEELQLQEAINSSLSTSTVPMEIKKPAEAESSRSQTLCTICTNTKSAAAMSITSKGCSHSFCTDCISKHIAAKLQDNLAVMCPEPKCAAALEPEMCGSFVPKEVLERWGDALFEAMILKTKKFYCPFEDCKAAMIDEGGEAVTAAECPSCRRMFCAQCKVGWHGEMECGEFQKSRKDGAGDGDDMMAIGRKKWKRCPNCKIYVDKIKGCLYIICRYKQTQDKEQNKRNRTQSNSRGGTQNNSNNKPSCQVCGKYDHTTAVFCHPPVKKEPVDASPNGEGSQMTFSATPEEVTDSNTKNKKVKYNNVVEGQINGEGSSTREA